MREYVDMNGNTAAIIEIPDELKSMRLLPDNFFECDQGEKKMSILATLSPDAQLTDSQGIITRVHIDSETGEADGYEVIAPLEVYIAVEAYERLIAIDCGWRRFLSPKGVAYVHAEAEEVEGLALLLAEEARK